MSEPAHASTTSDREAFTAMIAASLSYDVSTNHDLCSQLFHLHGLVEVFFDLAELAQCTTDAVIEEHGTLSAFWLACDNNEYNVGVFFYDISDVLLELVATHENWFEFKHAKQTIAKTALRQLRTNKASPEQATLTESLAKVLLPETTP